MREFWIECKPFLKDPLGDQFNILKYIINYAPANKENFIHVREVDPNVPDWKQLCEDMNEALSRFKGLKEAVEINHPDEVIIRCEVSVSDIRCMAKVLRRYRKATEGK